MTKWVSNMTPPLWERVGRFLKIYHLVRPLHFGEMSPERAENMDLKRDLPFHVHSSCTHNHRKVEANLPNAHSQRNGPRPYSGTVIGLKKEFNSDTGDNRDKA